MTLFLFLSVIDGFEWFWMGSLDKNIGGGPQSSILGPALFLLYMNEFPDDITCDIAICADDTTLYSKCDQASDLWQQLELT